MLSLTPLLGINSQTLGKLNSLITPSKLYRKSQIHTFQLNQITPLAQQTHLLQASNLLVANLPNRINSSQRQSEIGWDNWQPTDRSSDRDDFDYKVDRSRYDLTDQSSQTDNPENLGLDFFTTVLPTEFAEIDSQLDALTTNPIDAERSASTNKSRSLVADIQPQPPEKIQPKSVKPDQKLLDPNQINQIEQQKSSAQLPQVFPNTKPSQILQSSPETVEGIIIKPETESSLVEPLLETTIGSSLDNFGLNTINDSFLEPLPATNIDLNLDVPKFPDLDLTQISRSVVDRVSLQENQTTPNLASSPKLILDPIVPNSLDAPTTINPVPPQKVALLEPEVKTTIIQSTVSSEILTPFNVGEQIAPTTALTPIPESSDRLASDPITPNPLDFPTVVDPKLPEVATIQPPLLAQRSTPTENIPSVMPLVVEPVRESIPDTLPVDRSDLPIINQPLSTDPIQVIASLDELAIANLDVPALTSGLRSEDIISAISPLSADRAQIATAPNQICPETQSYPPLIPATTQLNLAADPSDIDRDSAPSVQLEPANPNIPESPSTLLVDVLSTNLLPVPDSEQIAIPPTSIEANQIVSAGTPQLNSPDSASVNQTPSALEPISTFADEPTPVNLESSAIPIVESLNTLSEPDLTIESIPRLNVDTLQLNIDRSLLENSPVASTEVIKVEQENITEANNEFGSENSLVIPLIDRSIINQTITITESSQNTSQIEHLSGDTINKSDDVISPINNSTNPIQVALQTTALPTIGQVEFSSTLIDSSIDPHNDNSSDITIPAPIVGYATGGYVKDANHIDLQSIATSDTVSAMLTPGEFVINAKDAQKNLDLLTHINRGGEPESALTNTEIQPSITETASASPDISPTSIQRKRNESLILPSLQREIGLQQLSPLLNTGLDTFDSNQMESSNSSQTYSLPSMIFRKSMSSSQSRHIGADTPDRWGSIEDLISGGSNNSDLFSFDPISPQQPDLESRSSPMISPQYATPISGFADGGEVTPSDISTTIEPITQTIESPLANSQPQPANNDPAELEILAREIYHRLRQRLEIERERHGSYSGNLAW